MKSKKKKSLCRNEQKEDASHLPPSSRQQLLHVYVEDSWRQVRLPGHLVGQQVVEKPLSNFRIKPPHAEVAERDREQRKNRDKWETWGNGQGEKGVRLGRRKRVEERKV